MLQQCSPYNLFYLKWSQLDKEPESVCEVGDYDKVAIYDSESRASVKITLDIVTLCKHSRETIIMTKILKRATSGELEEKAQELMGLNKTKVTKFYFN